MAKNASEEYIFPILLYVQLVLQKLTAKTVPILASFMPEEHTFIFSLQFNILKWQEIAKAWNCSEKRGTKDKFMWMFWKFKIKTTRIKEARIFNKELSANTEISSGCKSIWILIWSIWMKYDHYNSEWSRRRSIKLLPA